MNAWRLQRATAVCIGISFILMPLLSINVIATNAYLTATWWVVVSIVLQVGSGVLLVVAATDRFRHLMPQVMLIAAGMQFVILALWFLARTGKVAAWVSIDAVWVTGMSVMAALGICAMFGYRYASPTRSPCSRSPPLLTASRTKATGRRARRGAMRSPAR